MSVSYDILNNPPVLAYQRRPPPRELVILNAPNMLTYRGADKTKRIGEVLR